MITLELVASSPVQGDPGDNRTGVAKLLKKQLRKQDLVHPQVRSCRDKRGGAAWVCDWRASGTLGEITPFECEGKAKFNADKRRWKGARCADPMVQLMPQPGPHPTFGYNEDWRPEMYSNGPRLDLIAGSGADSTRQLLFWGQVEGLFGQRGWASYDVLYDKLLSRGIRPLWVLWGEPCWARPSGSNCFPWTLFGPPNPENFDELADFAAEAAKRYPESIGFEIWNEPNNAAFWGGTPSPQVYGQMLQTVVPAIKAADPAMPVITAGLAPHRGTDEAGMDYETFLRQAYVAGGPQLTDAIGAHPYALRRPEQDYLASARANLFRYLRVMTEFGEQEKPIWVTEIGYSTEGEDEGFSYQQQADALVKTYAILRRVANLPTVMFHRLMDQPGHEQEKEQGYGVADVASQPKPAYCAVAAAREQPC